MLSSTTRRSLSHHAHKWFPTLLMNHTRPPLITRFYSTAVNSPTSSIPPDSQEERPLFIVTDRCAEKINSIKEQDNNKNIKLRVAVDSGGCSGYKYAMELEENVEPEDIVYERNGAQVIVDRESIKYLEGSRIDFTSEMIGERFKILDNPQSGKSCGCGTSFNLKERS